MANVNCGACGHLNSRGYCNLTACIFPCSFGTGGYINKPITNADRIRAMTDEELAGILAMPSIISPPWCSEKYDCPYADQDPVRCDLCALDWLKESAD